jgi:hypothetical protein
MISTLTLWSLVIYLFGGYIDTPVRRRVALLIKTLTKGAGQTDNQITTNHIAKNQGWDLSLWFALLSPAIGVAIGLLGLLIFAK